MRNPIPALVCVFALAAAVSAASPDESASKSAQTHYLQALLLERRGEVDAAMSEYEKAFSYDPRSASICRQAAEMALEAGNPDAAKSWIERLEQLDAQNAQTQMLIGRFQWGTGDAAGAEKAFETALKLDPKSAESIFSLGSLLSAHSPGRARRLFLNFLEQNPEHAAEAHFQIALLDQKENRLDEAVRHLKESIALEPGAAPSRYTLAQIYEIKRDTDAALGEYAELLKLDAHNVALIDHVGELYFIKGQLEQAKEKFEAAQRILPSDPVSCQWLAMIAEKAGDFPRAVDYLKASSALNEDASLSLRLSYYLTQAGRLKEAIAVLEKAHQRWPASDEIAYFLALGYDDLKSGGKAIDLLRQVLSLKPGYRDARYQLAVLLEKYGRIEEAEKEFRALLGDKPDDAGILNYLGYSLADRGIKLDAAQELIERAVRIDPRNGAYQDSLGWVYFKQGRSTEAVHVLMGAARRLPDDPTVWDHLGDAELSAADHAGAWRAWKKAQSLDPANPNPGKKASRLQAQFGAEELGAYYLDHLAQLQGEIKKFSGLCEISGSILGRSFSYTGILTYRDPEVLDVDFLGPLFTPVVRIRLDRERFAMDPARIDGLDGGALSAAAAAAFSLLRDYFSGGLLRERPARYASSWRKLFLHVPSGRLLLSGDGSRVEGVTAENPAVKLDLGDFSTQNGRQIPLRLVVTGRGYAITIRMRKAAVEFK